MDFLEKLDFMLQKFDLNKNLLSQKSGIPYTTIDGWYKKGYEGLKISTLKKIASYFNTSLDYWVVDSITDPNHGRTSSFKISFDEMKHIEKYRHLDIHGKNIADTIIDLELKRIEESTVNEDVEENIVYINFAQNSASAGSGDVLFGDIDDTPLALVENRITNKADFAVRVNGNSMLPNFSNGDIVLASKQPVDNGDIGLFVVNGNGYIKKKGSRELISLNPKFDNVQIGEYDTVYCMGKVIGKVEDEWIR
jgi:hypothetical protein